MNDAKTDRQLRLYVGLVAFGGLCCLVWAVNSLTMVAPGKLLYLAALTVIIALTTGRLIELRIRSDYRSFTSTSGAILVAVATIPLPWAVICTTLGILIAKIFMRDALKISFNVAKNTLAATAAGAAAYLAGIRPPPDLSFPGQPLLQLVTGLILAALVAGPLGTGSSVFGGAGIARSFGGGGIARSELPPGAVTVRSGLVGRV